MAESKKPALTGSLSRDFDFDIDVYKEQQPGKGEDCSAYVRSEDYSRQLVAVFDGCGGSGSRRYSSYGGRTGAYMASRALCGAAGEWFRESFSMDEAQASLGLKDCFQRALRVLSENGREESRIKGNIGKEFPSTAALCACTEGQEGLNVLSLWAGDSRCYMLSASGLKQLSLDDTGLDAMEDLSADGILQNVVSASKDYKLNASLIRVNEPCFVFTATDGCFGYLPSPMHFEYLLERTLEDASVPVVWQRYIYDELLPLAGDDYSLKGICLGFGSMEELKSALRERTVYMWKQYIEPFPGLQREQQLKLWQQYSEEYSSYLKK